MRRGAYLQGLLAAAALVLSGCEGCDSQEPTCTEAVVSFDAPESGASVDAPFDVSLVARLADGSAFQFDSASLRVNGQTLRGEVSGNRATWTGVSAAAGPLSLTGSIARGSCSKSATTTVTVRGQTCSSPTVSAVSFPQDRNTPLGVLNAAELPQGTPLQVRVAAGCVEDVQVRIKRGTEVVGALTSFTGGVALVTLPSLPDADVATYDLFAELVRDGVAVNTPSGAALASIQVRRAAPACEVTTSGVFGPAHDAQPGGGYQVRLTGTMAPESTGYFDVTGEPIPVAPNEQGEVSADLQLSPVSATYTVRLTCSDGAGNSTVAQGSFETDFDAPTVTIVSPASVNGVATEVVSQSPLTLQVSAGAGEGGGTVRLLRDGQSVDAQVLDAAGAAQLAVSFASDGTWNLTVEVTDRAGNVGTADLQVTVALSGCGLVFSRPASSPVLLTPSQLQGTTYSFRTVSRAACAGQVATLYRAVQLADGGTQAEQPVGTATLAGTGVADFSPLEMTNGTYRFRGEVANPGSDAGVSGAAVSVTVDLAGPSITQPVPASGQPFALLTVAQDAQPGVPGVQRMLSYSAQVPMGGRVDVCTTQAVDPVTGSARLTSAGCGAGWYLLQQSVASPAPSFTFPEGAYSIKVVVEGSGVTPAPASAALSVVADATRPCVQGASRTLPQDTNGDGRLNAAELNGAQPVLEFDLGCGDVAATLSATAPVVVRNVAGGAATTTRPATAVLTGGRYTVTLTGDYSSEADLDLFVELTDLVGNKNLYSGSSDPAAFSFRVDPVLPSCTVVSPSAPLLGLAQVPGGNLDVVVGRLGLDGLDGLGGGLGHHHLRAQRRPDLHRWSQLHRRVGQRGGGGSGHRARRPGGAHLQHHRAGQQRGGDGQRGSHHRGGDRRRRRSAGVDDLLAPGHRQQPAGGSRRQRLRPGALPEEPADGDGQRGRRGGQ